MATPETMLGDIVVKRTYSRRVGDRIETWEQLLDRVLLATQTQLHIEWTPQELADLRRLFVDKKCSVAGRALWQLGTKTVQKYGLMSLQNCSFMKITDPVRDFSNMMDESFLGVGVGFRVTPDCLDSIGVIQHATITHVRSTDADFIVPDSREGWVKLVGLVMRSHFAPDVDQRDFTYSTILLRERGTPIASFGGVSAGYGCLVDAVRDVNIMLNKHATTLPTDVILLDIATMLIGIVVAGNIRRSALLCLGTATPEFMLAKDWTTGTVPPNRAFSNNSIVCDDIHALPASFWDSFEREGEIYGLINIGLMRKMGRIGETQYPDPRVEGVNPCAEQTLEDQETCNLAEVFLPNITSYAELQTCVFGLYRINKHIMCELPCHIKSVSAVVKRNARMGIGMTGILECSEEQLAWLDPMYKDLREYDFYYSTLRGWPVSIKLTTVKPSGTLSLMAGIGSPGIHATYAAYYIRRVRISSDSPLVRPLIKMGYGWEYTKRFDNTLDYCTTIIEFPMKSREGAILAKDLTAVQQMEWVKRLNTIWSDNAISCTVYIRKGETASIRAWLEEHYNDNMKAVSFLHHSDSGFIQQPLEEITKSEYEQRISMIHIDAQLMDEMTLFSEVTNTEKEIALQTQMECEGGACPIR